MKMLLCGKAIKFLSLLFLFNLGASVISPAEAAAKKEVKVKAVDEGAAPTPRRLAVAAKPSPAEAETKDKETKESLSAPEQFMQKFFKASYHRDFVTRFVSACPPSSQTNLARAIGRTASTICKLQKPEKYGPLEPTAQLLWKWVGSRDIKVLETTLGWTKKDIVKMERSLSLMDFSGCDIVYDSLGESIRTEGKAGSSGPRLASEIAHFLEPMRGTFTRINFSNNILSDEGLAVLVPELLEHQLLEEVNVRNNNISDKGLRALKPLLRLDHLKVVDVSGNYGPSAETLEILRAAIPDKNRAKLKIVTDKKKRKPTRIVIFK